MKTISVILRGSGIPNEYKLEISSESKVLDFRLNAQTLMGFDDDTCQLILERTGANLSDSLSVESSNIQSGDILIIIPPARISSKSLNPHPYKTSQSSYRQVASQPHTDFSNILITYKLILTINSPNSNIWEYSVALQRYHENNPAQFFEDFGGEEQKKLEHFLEETLKRKPLPSELRKVLSDWCDDILSGYRETLVSLQQ